VPDNTIDKKRRRFLIGVTSFVSALGVVSSTVPFLSSWSPSERARAEGASVKVDISLLSPGQQIIVECRGKPIWIIKRTDEMLENLKNTDVRLADPNSIRSNQPSYIPFSHTRSLKKNIIVMIGLCTHLGCSPSYRPEIAPVDLGLDWRGGFFCPCHGSRFDLSGRVFDRMPAPKNLEIPPHYYLNDKVILIGEDEGSI
jgi:ubiquinol-cytochrome c reductase iron-sulfur subunit